MLDKDEIMTKGMECLVRELGDIEAQIFISTVNREQLDFKEWCKILFNGATLEELKAAEYEKTERI